MVKLIENESEIPTQGKVVIDFFATWCGPCKMIAPFFEDISAKYPSITFLKVDVDESPELVDKYNISVMPTFLYLINNTVVHIMEGASQNAIVNVLDALVKSPS